MKVHTAEPLMPDPSPLETEISTSWKNINREGVINFRQNSLNQEA